LEKRVAEIEPARPKGIDEGRERFSPGWLKDGQFTMSDAIRRAAMIELDVLDGDADAIKSLFLEHFVGKLQQLLARAIVDPKVAKQLKRMSAFCGRKTSGDSLWSSHKINTPLEARSGIDG
jgi:hypothetical protein